ncbi:N-acetyltransferase DgcN [Tsuneonella amylolytica]|uniref:N-acetyltransferase DgcN n=1 Tax=Tsuneonella amylolytica TaxID=2338327 RepID=UPI000EAA941B|nr:N-acetyltransferase DgcN [Tsuneonella amylolytica]
MIDPPYLLYLGNSTDHYAIKTARGLAVFRPELCIGEYRGNACTLTLELPRMTFAEAVAAGARTMVLGIVNAGGTLDPDVVDDCIAAMEAGLDLASGLHQRMNGEPRLVAAAVHTGRRMHDIRTPPADLVVGSGDPRPGNRLLTVGTDCSSGKMYTTLALHRAMQARGIPCDFRATGQTGIMVAAAGIPLDAVIADFISGAIEQLAPARHDEGWDLIEGQGSLFHPSFAGVSTGLLHGAQPAALVMCHDPSRRVMRGMTDRAPPDLGECIAANLATARLTSQGVRMAGIALNTSAMDHQDAVAMCLRLQDEHGLPCTDPHRMGVEPILDALLGTTQGGAQRAAQV